MSTYSLDLNREMPYLVIDLFDNIGREGVYAGTYEDCRAFIDEQVDDLGLYKIILNK